MDLLNIFSTEVSKKKWSESIIFLRQYWNDIYICNLWVSYIHPLWIFCLRFCNKSCRL